MTTQLFVTGPASIYVGTGTSFAYEFLGWSEGDVRLSFDAAFEDIHTDLGGSRIPTDVLYMSEQAFAFFTLVRFNEGVWEKLMDRLLAGTPGVVDATTIGTLMLQEGKTFPLFIDSPYQSKGSMTTMDQGHEFKQAYLMDSWDMEKGTRLKRQRVAFRAITPLSVTGGGTLYSLTRPGGLPSLA